VGSLLRDIRQGVCGDQNRYITSERRISLIFLSTIFEMILSTEAICKLQSALNNACADPDKSLPGVVGVAAGRYGKYLFPHACGNRGFGSKEPMSLDNIFWIALYTKLRTGIACIQLVEQGKLSLDDAAQTEDL
jgi:CubicO group peptidase (beta-lactamase class C family)